MPADFGSSFVPSVRCTCTYLNSCAHPEVRQFRIMVLRETETRLAILDLI